MLFSMKAFFAIVCLALPLFVSNAKAQVYVELKLDQEQFLPGEAIPVTIRVTNRSGQSLHLGEDGWLSFLIQAEDGSVVIKKTDPPVKDPFDLENGDIGIKRMNLAPYFSLAHDGTFHISATVHIKDWSTDITSQSQNFDIIEGAEIWSQAFGVPDSSVSNQPPRVRKYSLVQANYLRNELRLYIQVIDEADGAVVKVNSLGPMISFSQPEAQLDRASNLHVLCQTGATAFTYSTVNPGGDVIHQEIYDYVNTRPRLSEDVNGNIFVMGGVRRAPPGEIPAVKPPDQTAP